MNEKETSNFFDTQKRIPNNGDNFFKKLFKKKKKEEFPDLSVDHPLFEVFQSSKRNLDKLNALIPEKQLNPKKKTEIPSKPKPAKLGDVLHHLKADEKKILDNLQRGEKRTQNMVFFVLIVISIIIAIILEKMHFIHIMSF